MLSPESISGCSVFPGEAEAGAGEIDVELRRLDNALAELERTEQRWYEAEIHRIRGEILLKRDPGTSTACAAASRLTAR